MKTFRFLGMALLAVVLCVNFTACSDDDSEQNENGNQSGENLKLASVTWDLNDGGTEYSYDAQGHISEVAEYDEAGELSSLSTIEYNSDNIVVTTDDGYHEDICSLNANGQIVKSVCTSGGYTKTAEYAYNAEGYLISIYEVEYDETTNLTWENGNLIKADDGYMEKTYAYTSTPSEKGFTYLDDILIDIFPDNVYLPLLANSGYFGKVPKNLLASAAETYQDSGDSSSWNLDYEFGDNGYVTKISAVGGADFDDSWVSLTWK